LNVYSGTCEVSQDVPARLSGKDRLKARYSVADEGEMMDIGGLQQVAGKEFEHLSEI
jgi:hypothetical protein